MVSRPNRTPQHPELAIWQRVQQQRRRRSRRRRKRRRRRGRGRTKSLKSCLAGEENRSIQVLRWVRAGSVGPVESMSPWGPCGSVGSVRVRGVRVSFGP